MPGIENFSILSIGGFIFFLLVFLVGYILVEIIFGEKYIFRKSFEKYGNNLFDRIIHYIFWGIITNIVYLYFLISQPELYKNLSNIFNISGKLGESLSFLGDVKGIQFITFSVYYFMTLLSIVLLVELIILIIKFILNIKKIYNLFVNFIALNKADKKKKGK